MLKQMKKAISFIMAVCLLAGNSYVDTGAPAVSMSDWIVTDTAAVTNEAADTGTDKPSHPQFLMAGGLQKYIDEQVRVASAAEEDAMRYAFLHPYKTGEAVLSGNVIEVSTESTDLGITMIDENGNPLGGFDTNISVTWESLDEEVVTVTSNPATPYSAKITRQGPGYAQVRATITDNNTNKVYPITCYMKVEVGIVKTDSTHWKAPTDDSSIDDGVLVLETDPYTMELKYIDNKDIEATDLSWSWTGEGIISIDKGVVTPIGAGHSTVTITTDTLNEDGKQDTITFEVIVRPEGHTDPTAAKDTYINVVPKRVTHVNSNKFVDEFSLYSNGQPASNLKWKFYAIEYNNAGVEQPIELQQNNNLFRCEINDLGGDLRFQGVKAGTYRVVGYASDKYGEKDWNKVVYDVIVDLSLGDTDVYMGDGDLYDIVENSNIPEGRFGDLFSMAYLDNQTGPNVVSFSSSKGTVNGDGKGEADIQIQYNVTKGNSIFDPYDDLGNYEKNVVYTFIVTDGITLNSSVLHMYTDTTYKLVPEVTDHSEPLRWSSSDPNTVHVDQDGLITALKPTKENQPVTITVSQLINNVYKSAHCIVYVQKAVKEIKLDPAELTLDINAYATVVAQISPSDIISTNLRWTTSDPNVFVIAETTTKTATIKAVGGGTAVLAAINADNIVVGYCKVMVNQLSEKLELSDEAVPVKMADQKYQLYATVYYDGKVKNNATVLWSSLDTKIATVDEHGIVTFKKPGTVTIRAVAADNPGVAEDFCIFTIEDSVSGVRLDITELEMYVGEIERLTYEVKPSTINSAAVTWQSFDPSIVSVDKTGKITAKAPGTTQIMIMTEEGSYYDLCTVVVKQDATGVKMNYTEVVINRGEYFDLDVTVYPATSTEKNLIWESWDTKVVTVSSTGRITARSAGEAIVVVQTQSGAMSHCTVTVVEPVVALELDPDEVFIDVGEKFTIAPVFKPKEPTNVAVKWTSSNPGVAKVNSIGEVEGMSRGTTVITCETVDGGFRAFCLVTVADPELEIEIIPSTYRLGLGKSFDLAAVVTSHGKEIDVALEWSSSDESICSVNQFGEITGEDYGFATITATMLDDYGISATCEVRVVREVTSLKLNHNAITIVVGQSVALKTDIQPSNATYQTATFTSSNSDVAMVDDDGLVTGLKAGTTMVRADARDNSGKYALCFVTVIDPIPATGITVSDKEIVLVPGEKKQIVSAIRPSNSTDALTWTSNNEYIASVDGNGNITAHTTGRATVTVMTTSGKTATVDVIVLGLSRTTLEIPVYTKYSRLTVDGATMTVRWDVQDTSICEVVNGVITARKVGTTYVTATMNGRTLRCKVTVTGNGKNK